MNELTVIVTARGGADDMKKTLESLCDQSVEDFDVLIVLRGADKETETLAQEYCGEYVGFQLLNAGEKLIPEARNLGAENARSPLLLFLEAGDYLAPDSAEAILKTAEKTNAEVTGWRSSSPGPGLH